MVNVLHISNQEECEGLTAPWGGVFQVRGKWEDGACLLVEGEDGGWTAPAKGAYIAWGVRDMEDFFDEFDKETRYEPSYFGCLVGDGPYPSFAGGCSPIIEDEFHSGYEDKEESMGYARDSAKEIIRDIRKGKAESWGLKYCDADTGNSTDFESSRAVAGRRCKDVKKHFDWLKENVIE